MRCEIQSFFITLHPMNNLSRHIEYLLLTHNCVVVPQFGAFVVHESNASRVESENLFFPPSRMVRFNPEVVEDDGLLVSLVRTVHHCQTTEAKRMVQGMVLNLRQQLLADGQVDFGSIGVFTQDEDGHVCFEPCQAGATTPSYFGLDAFVMPKLTAIQRNEKIAQKRKQTSRDSQNNTESHIIIHINRRALRYAVFSAAAILICVLFAIPIDFNPTNSSQQASVLPTQPTQTQQVVIPDENVEIEMTESDAVTADKEMVTIESQEGGQEENIAVEKPNDFLIVLASDVTLKNAERYVNDLKKRGFENAIIYNNGKMTRVVLEGYATEEEASNHNIELHRSSKEFTYSWVMRR